MAKEVKKKAAQEKKSEKKEAHDFYESALNLLTQSKADFLVGGGFALREYTGIMRDTKDLDVFCKSGECPHIMKWFNEQGYKTELTDPRWLAKAIIGDNFVDVIFNNPGNHCAVDDSWLERAVKGELFGVKVKYIPAEALIWSKLYVQNRERYDGGDINHIILRWGNKLDWKWIWMHMEPHWHLLLAQFLSFQFVYPSDRDIIPKWLFEELLDRARDQFDLPTPADKICLGPLIDQTQYATDITEWNYKVVTMRSI
ncbi:nucleotidyltransferase [Pontibacter sp. 172403-2]|uniref:nucleotidyltransferase n=1 Tax=Pontibacter rufus TaxID=2791028 RepID=UPI0018AF6F0C|nr:nucleotidyltransferase [Pontibacter sp. 172403-2]MBF9254538.1 nucleotidyltransferase [Pontibacter sp. 172403-2]